jgi:N-methylhydantoinase B
MIDAITVSVIHGALETIAVEMGYKLMRMAHSSIIRESEDFGAAIIDRHGRGLAESAQSTPLQSGPLPGYVRGMLREMDRRGETLRPGDVIMHNDPYGGASHGPDVGFIVPVFLAAQLVGFSATTAHHLDIGSLSPGSCGIVDAIDAYAEGLQFKAIKVYDAGRRVDQVWQILRDNIRAPALVVGDMEAQVAASRIGAERLLELIGRYGLETFEAASDAALAHTERLMRQAIAALPDGTWTAHTFIDGFSDSDDPARRDLRIQATVTVAGDELTVDLTGTAPQVPDRPINMPFEGTVDIAVWLTIRSILLDTAVHGHIPVNEGLTRPIRIIAPKGCLANPIFPAPTIARFAPGNQLADTVMRALAQVVPQQVSAGIGNLRVMAFSGEGADGPWVHMEIFEGSYGGRPGSDGMDAVDTLYANTRNNPVEDIESHLPLRVRRYELRTDAIGAGQWRGGLGSVREFELLSDAGVSIEGDGHKHRPWGFAGGGDGHTATLHLLSGNTATELPSKMPYRRVRRGDRFVCVGPSGGGYGDPALRDRAAVRDDVADGLLSGAAAKLFGATQGN